MWLVLGIVVVLLCGVLWWAYHKPAEFKSAVDNATDAAKKEVDDIKTKV